MDEGGVATPSILKKAEGGSDFSWFRALVLCPFEEGIACVCLNSHKEKLTLLARCQQTHKLGVNKMTTLIDEQTNTLKSFIINLVTTNYSSENKGILLSRIGEIVSKDQPELRNALGKRKLAGFIGEELADSVRIYPSPENSIVKIVLPTEVKVSNVLDFIPTRSNTNGLTTSLPRYNRAFWAAFSHPLAEGYARLVMFEPQINYMDVEGEPTPENTQKILERDSIIDPTIESNPTKRINLINEKIKSWLQIQSIDIDTVLAKNEKKPDHDKQKELSNITVLERLLAALDEPELKRIQLPLDIVAKLNRRI